LRECNLEVAAPRLASYVIPSTVGILFALFAVQRHGTAKVGAIFGPLTLIWFAVLAALGIRGIVQAPEVLLAIDPCHAIRYFFENGMVGYFAIYAIFLVTTGGEALYADLGHFGRIPIRQVWFSFVLPSLLLNYFGQGALLVVDPAGSTQPFYHLAPSWGLFPLTVLATVATCIASQAVITGAYSMTRQAVHLGLLPGLKVEQTSADARGQIYMPTVNWFLMIAAVGLVLAFLLGFLFIDLGFLGANLVTIFDGGWLPLLIGMTLFIVMTTWRRGASLLAEQIAATTANVETFIGRVKAENIPRVPGTAIFFTGRLEQTPPALQQLVRSTGVLHEQVVLATVVIEPVPRIESAERLELTTLDAGFYRLVLRYGFMQRPNIPSDPARCTESGLAVNLGQVRYFMGHVDLLAGRKLRGMAAWRDRLFVRMATQHPGCHGLLPDTRRASDEGRPANRHLRRRLAERQV